MIRLLTLSVLFFFVNPKARAFDLSISELMRTESSVLNFKKKGLSFSVTWEVGPSRGDNKFIMRTWNDDLGTMNGPYQAPQETLHVFLWMPSMGHGSTPVSIKTLSGGEFEISKVNFMMRGKWEIRFQLKNGNQVVDETVLPLTI